MCVHAHTDTIFAFAPKHQAVGRVRLCPLDGSDADAGVDVPALLGEFQLKNAQCYDPNEEGKIRGIIDECGKASFEAHIRELGRAVREGNQAAIDGT